MCDFGGAGELGGWGIADLQAALSLQKSTSATVTTRLPSPAITNLEWLSSIARDAVLVRASYKLVKEELMKELAGMIYTCSCLCD